LHSLHFAISKSGCYYAGAFVLRCFVVARHKSHLVQSHGMDALLDMVLTAARQESDCVLQILGEGWRRIALEYQEQAHRVAIIILKAIFIGLGRDENIIDKVKRHYGAS